MDGQSKRASGSGPKWRKAAGIGSLMLLCLWTSGCRYTAAPADLLQQPSIASDKQQLVQAVEAALPAYGKLAIPLRGDETEAIRLVDYDRDGIDEAIASYYNEFNAPEMMLFEREDEEWRMKAVIEQPLARQLDWLDIEDLDGDGAVEMFVGWIGNGSFDSPSLLEVYRFGQNPVMNEEGQTVLKPVESMPYVYADAGDVNGDGQKELAVVTAGVGVDSGDGRSLKADYRLSLYKWSEGALAEMQSLPLSPDVNTYERVLIGRISERKSGIVVEASAGAHSSVTELYAWENGKLRRVPLEEQDQGMSWTPVRNRDIDGDGIIELAVVAEPPGNSGLPYAETLWITEWKRWDGKDGYVRVREEYSDYAYGFRFVVPDDWSGRYTLSRPAKDEGYAVVQFDYWNGESGSRAELATVYVVPQKDWEGYQAGRKEAGGRPLSVLETGGGLVYAVSLKEEAPEGLAAADREAYLAMLMTQEEAKRQLTLIRDDE
ncbi:FG-GAP repeat domain-containing protein [Paenibacillus thailandensis]|uniref:FG-GAP repeat domain-containing protein n=1 Tax=Paenibacillus thailandensis TaxID=393250 RepID=A0ABW5QYX4_9BACL